MEDMMDHRSRAKLVDVAERRSLAEPLSFRKDGPSGQYVLEGYASTWDPYDCYGGPQAGGWVEQIDQNSMKRTLDSNPDLMLLVNHEGLPLARTTTDTIKLTTDKHGLLMRAFLDPADPDVQRLAPKLKKQANGRSNMDEMSFAFRVKDQVWNNNYDHRLITELSLQKGDVSVVNYGMNPNTHVQMMDAIGQLAQLSDKQLVEVRSNVDHRVLAAASQVLSRALNAGRPEDRSAFAGGGAFVNFDGSHLLYEGNCVTCSGARARGQLGNIPYADPGFIDSVPRLPVDELHVKASWQYFNQPKNQLGYSSEQLAQIRGSIQTAMTMHGHDVDEEKGMAEVEISHIEAVRQFGGGVSLVAVMTDGSYTPLPSFRQSGELVGPAAGDGGNPFGALRSKPADDTDDESDTSERGKVPPQFQKPADKDKPAGDDKDPQDKPADDKNPKDAKKPEKKAANDPDSEDNPDDDAADQYQEGKYKRDDDMETYGILRGNGHPADCDCAECMAMDARSGRTDDEEPDDEPDTRSASERLAELRGGADLPDRPSVTDALEYIRALA